MTRDRDIDHNPIDTNRNEKVELISTVARCSLRAGTDIAALALDPKTIALATDHGAKEYDRRRQTGPRPDQFGEFPEIPLDTIVAVVTVADDGKVD